LGAYKNRSITGVRPKDEEKVETLREVIMPNDRMGDIPGEYREQHLAFLEQYRKLESERKRLGLIGLKAHVLSTLERNPALVELAQGKMDGALSFFTGSNSFIIESMEELQMPQIDKVKMLVRELLGGDVSGHADDHVERVALLAERFASECSEPVDLQEVLLTAWLHDVDDYKLVGKAQAEKLTNAVNIMAQAEVVNSLSQAVLENIAAIGYSKRLNGRQPQRLAGQIVSDADMCDAIGAVGIERALVYACHHGGRIFDPAVWPNVNLAAHEYNADGNTHDTDGFINHFFEKLLKLKGLMLTEPGRIEAKNRQQIMVDFLSHYFREKNAPEWSEFLEEYLRR